jgi:dTDP-glucose pyrophosphorylase
MNGGRDAFAALVVDEHATIRDAMTAINSNGCEVALVRDPAGRIAGLITDGDIRRGLLAGLGVEASVAAVMTREFFNVAPGADRAYVLDVMRARQLAHVPVLDAERRLVAVHFLRALIGASEKPNAALVMAGGRGTRLRPVADKLPKPMVEVAGRPMLERIVLHLVGHGIRRIYIAVNFMAETIERHFGDGTGFGCRIEYLRESSPLGTGGALCLLPAPLEHPLLVLNGDLVTRADLSAMLEAHAASGCAATMAVGPYEVQLPFGAVTERAGRLVSLEEKPAVRFLVNRGIYVLEPAVLKHVPANREFAMTALFDALLADEQPVGVYNFEDSWLDVGAPEDLRRAHGWS